MQDVHPRYTSCDKYLSQSTREKSVKKLLFQVENWSLQEIHSLHTNYKKLISFRLNKEHPGISPSLHTHYKEPLEYSFIIFPSIPVNMNGSSYQQMSRADQGRK